VQGSDGNFYGTTFGGGPYDPQIGGDGTVFKISTNGALTTLYSFTDLYDGARPNGLVQGTDGNFYGTTGLGFYGDTVFKISANGALTTLHYFAGSPNPASLLQGSDGNFYGTTYWGGTDQRGTVFKITPTGAYTSLYSFTGGNDGGSPEAALVQGSDGYFYGTTSRGGTEPWPSDNGTVFKISASGALTTLYAFGTVTNAYGEPLDGGNPYAGLVQGSDGCFYGATVWGGTNNTGTVFEISTNGALTTLYSFTGGNDGGSPYGDLVQGSDGNFYGTTEYGGQGGAGTIFRLTIVPEFQAATLTNSMLSLTWSTERGGVYRLQCNSDLSSSNWISLGSPFTATAATLSTTDIITNGPERFYRLVLSP
jgi:uncharacterized repeat protein (TIGR03803 family)